jgi:hypothetical protein
MAARSPKADTYSMSGNQAVLSAGISKADMDFLVLRAQRRGTDRAKLVREIMTEWREREEALDAAEAFLGELTEVREAAIGDDPVPTEHVIHDAPRDGDQVVDTNPPEYYRNGFRVVEPVADADGSGGMNALVTSLGTGEGHTSGGLPEGGLTIRQ